MPGRSRAYVAVALVSMVLSLADSSAAQVFGSDALGELQPIDMAGDSFRVSALLFGDAFSIQGHHLGDFDGESGWWTRRIYFTTDFANFGLGDTVIRLRLEANQLGDFSTGFKSTLKDAYVQFRPGSHRIWLGRVPTLTFGAVEAHWGFRWFEKTALDIQGANSRLGGIRVAGPLTPGGPFYYRFAAGRSRDLGFATEHVRKGQLAVTYLREDRKFFADLYLDYLDENQEVNQDTAWSYQLHGGWNGKKDYAGGHYFHREWDRNEAERFRLASAYYVHVFGSRRWDLVTRVDYLFDPSIKGDGIDYIPFDPTARATALYGGIGIKLHRNFEIMPNVKYVTYGRNDEGIRPDADVYLKLTVNITIP